MSAEIVSGNHVQAMAVGHNLKRLLINAAKRAEGIDIVFLIVSPAPHIGKQMITRIHNLQRVVIVFGWLRTLTQLVGHVTLKRVYKIKHLGIRHSAIG